MTCAPRAGASRCGPGVATSPRRATLPAWSVQRERVAVAAAVAHAPVREPATVSATDHAAGGAAAARCANDLDRRCRGPAQPHDAVAGRDLRRGRIGRRRVVAQRERARSRVPGLVGARAEQRPARRIRPAVGHRRASGEAGQGVAVADREADRTRVPAGVVRQPVGQRRRDVGAGRVEAQVEGKRRAPVAGPVPAGAADRRAGAVRPGEGRPRAAGEAGRDVLAGEGDGDGAVVPAVPVGRSGGRGAEDGRRRLVDRDE